MISGQHSPIRLQVIRGVVTSRSEIVKSLRVPKRGYSARVTMWPELWVRDENGKEVRYSGTVLGNARPGQEVAVMSVPYGKEPIALANLSTDEVFLHVSLDLTRRSGQISLTFLLGIFGSIPLAVIYILFDPILLPIAGLFASGTESALAVLWRPSLGFYLSQRRLAALMLLHGRNDGPRAKLKRLTRPFCQWAAILTAVETQCRFHLSD
jgi:hypothetical protein